MTIEIRPVERDELAGFFRTLGTAFLESIDPAAVADAVADRWDLSRAWAAVDGGRIVGTFRSWATELTLPGLERLPTAAVAAVTVLPTHTRRGLLRRMLEAEHAAARDRGEAIGALYAAEYPIYGRFGYGPATRACRWTIDAAATAWHGGAPTGIELIEAAEALPLLPQVYEAYRRSQPGEIRRRDYQWEFELGLRTEPWGDTFKGFVAVHRDGAGTVDGYARYSADERWEDGQPRYRLQVRDLHATSPAAEADLVRFLCGIDFASSVRLDRRRLDEPWRWRLTNARAAVMDNLSDALWVCLLDVPRALAARSYERSGALTLEVVGGDTGSERQRVRLDATPDGVECRPTDAAPELTIGLAALGAAYLGGVPLRDAALAGGADEHRPGALAEADALLRTADPPWCSTFF